MELLAVDAWGSDDVAVEWIAGRAGRRMPVVIDSTSPAARLIPLLKARKVKVISGGPTDMSKACGGIYQAALAAEPLLSHGGPGAELITLALAGAKKRKIGDAGGWGWDRRDPSVNIAPLVAATLAHYGASTVKTKAADRDPARTATFA